MYENNVNFSLFFGESYRIHNTFMIVGDYFKLQYINMKYIECMIFLSLLNTL
jgi:hypothetical protein